MCEGREARGRWVEGLDKVRPEIDACKGLQVPSGSGRKLGDSACFSREMQGTGVVVREIGEI